MLHKISIPPTRIIYVNRPKMEEGEETMLKCFLDIDKRMVRNMEIKPVGYNQNFTTKIGGTEYEVSSRFDTNGKHSVLEQFRNLILSENLI